MCNWKILTKCAQEYFTSVNNDSVPCKETCRLLNCSRYWRGTKYNEVRRVLRARTCVNPVVHRYHVLFPDVVHYPGKEITQHIFSSEPRKEGSISELAFWLSGRSILRTRECSHLGRWCWLSVIYRGPVERGHLAQCVCMCSWMGKTEIVIHHTKNDVFY